MNESTIAGSIAAVMSTSALRRGLPQTIAACAPNRYHCRSRSAMTAARASRSSATVRWVDTTKHLRNAYVGSQIFPAIQFGRPTFLQFAYVVPQRIADAQSLSRVHV